jgi:hypothetical protein
VSDYEFYDLSNCLAAPLLFGRGIDNPTYNLLASGTELTAEQQIHYTRLRIKMAQIQASLTHCDGDMTMNGVVNAEDLAILFSYWGMPSVADINNDTFTDSNDLALLLNNWGPCGD